MEFSIFVADIGRKKDAPEWVALFKAGWGKLADGVTYFVDKKAFERVAASVNARGNDVVFDHEHQTLGKGQAPAAGWIKELKWEEAAGIMARVEWTNQAGTYIAKQEYRYFSPVFAIDKNDQRVCWLHSVALANNTPHNPFNADPGQAGRKMDQTFIRKTDTVLWRMKSCLKLPDYIMKPAQEMQDARVPK